MNKLLLLGAGALLAFVSCAPSMNLQYRTGRIVNVTTGQEGRLLLGGWNNIVGRNTATAEFPGARYSGEYSILSSPNRRGGTTIFQLNITNGQVTTSTREVPNPDPPLYSGNILMRDDAGRAISCEVQVDAQSRGIGTCADGQGNRYTVQF